MGGPDPAPVIVPPEIGPSMPPSRSFPVSFSVAISFMVIVMGSVVGAVSPWPLIRDLGQAAAFISLAALLVALAEIIWRAVAENRVQFMSQVARERIDSTDPVDHEWRTFNEQS
jgi:hypothetical protein